ncbi:glycosyltransferase [Curtobacterium sp. MCPF17_052]|uniref:glycosyltransferase n=1 Tax=Curtobacterium sp. MCPF17_052 TaxID=2175655 RepID=UPI0024E03778|nr:glycosyltransferase [Curtobacterium sp. MCPF17_052]WIB13749.1 glycosyltransferase [Curtobacterium sp. MCPF17_052]
MIDVPANERGGERPGTGAASDPRGRAATRRSVRRVGEQRDRDQRGRDERDQRDREQLQRLTGTAATGRSRADTRAHSPVMVLIVLLATLGVVTYAVFLLNPANRGDFLPYGLVIVAESVLVGQSLLSMWTILSGGSDPRDFAFHNTQDTMFDLDEIDREGLTNRSHLWPMRVRGKRVVVDVFITVYGEELTKIAATVAAAVAMRGEHRTWILDDGRSDDVRALADRLGARYVRRLSSNGAKAGNINHALTLAKGDYFAVFDADFVPGKDFLFETVPFFADGSIAFVQTPQTYGNLHNLVSRGAGYMQTVFYRFIQPGRNRFNAAFCVGTNVIFRRAAIDDVGGIHTDSKSEDVWTSLHLHERGWKSVFIPMTLAVGDAPRDDRGVQQAAAPLGDRWIRDPAHALPVQPEAQADDGPAPAVLRDGELLPDRHRARTAAPGPAARDLLRPPTDEHVDRRGRVGALLPGLLPHAGRPGVLRARVVPLRDAAARGGVLPDLRTCAVERPLREGAGVARHRSRSRPGAVTVQLHRAPGARLRVPVPDERRRDLA